MLARLAARSVAAPVLRRGAALAPLQRRAMGAVANSGVDMNLGRTPERTAELERLAEEHNGFLFGELVRCLATPPRTRAPRARDLIFVPSPHRPIFCSRLPRARSASGRTGSTHTPLS